MKKISENTIKKLEREIKRFESFNSRLENAAKHFFKVMKQTNEILSASDTASIGYTNVYYLLKDNTELFTKNDLSCFYDEALVNNIINELVGTEKFVDMHKAIVVIKEVILEAYACRNKIREIAEEYSGTEELLDAVEMLVSNRSIALKKAYNEINKLKQKVAKETMVA